MLEIRQEVETRDRVGERTRFVNFSAFLGHPETMHFAPGEKRSPQRYSNKKPKKKSKRKTQRDNDRAARFQEKKRQEREAAVAEASPDSPPSHSVPSAVSSPRVEFAFSEPAPADVSADSNFSKMNVDGNVTSASVSDNLSSENSSKPMDEAQFKQWAEKMMTLLNKSKRNSEDSNETGKRVLEPP